MGTPQRSTAPYRLITTAILVVTIFLSGCQEDRPPGPTATDDVTLRSVIRDASTTGQLKDGVNRLALEEFIAAVPADRRWEVLQHFLVSDGTQLSTTLVDVADPTLRALLDRVWSSSTIEQVAELRRAANGVDALGRVDRHVDAITEGR